MIKNQLLISVLIGTYNRAEIMPRSVISVLRQSYKNIEIILVDDGSTDHTSRIAKAFRDERVIYLRHANNRGIAAATNTAFEHSKGEYIALMGDDDEWIDKEKLKKQMAIYGKEGTGNIGIVCTWWQDIKGSSVIRKHTPVPPNNWVETMLSGGGVICGSTPLMPRKIFGDLGALDERLKRGTDSDLFRRIIISGYDVEIVPEITTNVYVDSPNRMTLIKSVAENRKCIQAEQYVLEKFPQAFGQHPKAAAHRYFKMARYSYDIYTTDNDAAYLKKSQKYIKKGLSLTFNPKMAIWGLAMNMPGFKSLYLKRKVQKIDDPL